MTTTLYVPGTSEKDPKKLIMSQQLVAGQTATNTDSITALQANPYKLAAFTRVLSVTSGSQAITGIGFKPRFIQFQTGISGGASWMSFGQSDGTVNTCQELALNSGGTIQSYYQSSFAGIQRDNAAGTTYQSFVVASFDSDGFTLTWTKTSTPTATASITALCYR